MVWVGCGLLRTKKWRCRCKGKIVVVVTKNRPVHTTMHNPPLTLHSPLHLCTEYLPPLTTHTQTHTQYTHTTMYQLYTGTLKHTHTHPFNCRLSPFFFFLQCIQYTASTPSDPQRPPAPPVTPPTRPQPHPNHIPQHPQPPPATPSLTPQPPFPTDLEPCLSSSVHFSVRAFRSPNFPRRNRLHACGGKKILNALNITEKNNAIALCFLLFVWPSFFLVVQYSTYSTVRFHNFIHCEYGVYILPPSCKQHPALRGKEAPPGKIRAS